MYVCVYTHVLISGWAIVNKSLQITSDENGMEFMDRNCFFHGMIMKIRRGWVQRKRTKANKPIGLCYRWEDWKD